MSEYTPTTEQVKTYFHEGFLHVHDGTEGDGLEEFDRWHAEERRKAILDYEMNRKVSIAVENIDGKVAREWHAEEIRKAKAEAWEQGVRAQLGYEQDKAHPMTTKPVPYPTNPYRAP